MLQVHPTETWLRDECDGSVYFPDQDGQFNLQDTTLTPYSTLVVEGPTASGLNMRMGFSPAIRAGVQSSLSAPQQSQHASPLIGRGGPPPPMFRSVVASKKAPVTLIKVMKAKMSAAKKGGKPDFQCTGQMYIELTDVTANVGQVCEAVRSQWGSEYTVVSVEGLEIDDTMATQGQWDTVTCVSFMNCIYRIIGISFWKCPRRKLYAVTFSDIQECNGGPNRSTRSSFMNISDSSDDDLESEKPRKKKQRCDDKVLQRLSDEVACIRDMMADIMSLNANTNLPIGLRRVLQDTFKCQICHSVPVRPPVIVTKCCRNILGCQQCTNTWYSGPEAMSKTCPMCRADRGCNETMILHGLTDFMDSIKKVCGNDSEENSTQGQGQEQSD